MLVSAAVTAAWLGNRGGEEATYPIRDTESRDVNLASPFTKSISAPHKVVSGYSYRATDGARAVLLIAPLTALRADLADENSPGDAVLREAWKHMPGRFDRLVVAEPNGSSDGMSMRVLASSTYEQLRKRFGARDVALEHQPAVKISSAAATQTRAGHCSVPEAGVKEQTCTQPPTSLSAATMLSATRSWCGLSEGALHIALITQITQETGSDPDPEGNVTFVFVGQRTDRVFHIPIIVRPGSTDSHGVTLVCGSSARQISVSDFLSVARPVPRMPSGERSTASPDPDEGQGSLPENWRDNAPTATDIEALGAEWSRHASAQVCRTRMAAIAAPERLKEFANNSDETIRTWSGQYTAADFTALVTMGRIVRTLQADGRDDPPRTVATHIPEICETLATSDPGQ
ncbi:hypothetical protein ABZ636_36790 [Streptomyces sp. NPDC007251]|uniref:hypothetical protein n=1 Tax=Streptomyces sp. NPDC007251 TaxID=3154483 RepID=UPI0033F7D227